MKGLKVKVYLDHHSTTPVDPDVLDAMMPYFREEYGNASSVHSMGDRAKDAVEKAREQVAKVINADPEHIYFTNSATEANNIVLNSFKDRGIITTNSEHSSIMEFIKTCDKVSIIEIGEDGNLGFNNLRKYCATCPIDGLISVIMANNEIGTTHDINKIARFLNNPYYLGYAHTDAVQAVGKIKIDVKELSIDFLTFNAHKIYGPKGIGALYAKDASMLVPILRGGNQNIISSGTINVSAVVGFGKACELAIERDYIGIYNGRVRKLRDKLLENLKSDIPDLIINGTMKNRLPNNLNVSIPNLPSEVLIKGLDDVCVSGGSACKSGSIEPSYVIKALGNSIPECAVRFGLGKDTTEEEIDYASKRVVETYRSVNGK